jgi:glycosyltransferase involved in cell wall biosynthesis
MKILWLTNTVLPDHATMLSLSSTPRGGWLPSLADLLKKMENIELAVATNVAVKKFSCNTLNNIKYYAIPLIKYKGLSSKLISYYQDVEKEFQPDIIHIHGTENFHGLLTANGYLKTPALISIQGILDVCYLYYYGNLSFKDLILSRTLRDWVRFDGLIEQKFRMKKRSQSERKIFRHHKYFTGRTLWDYSHTKRLNPDAVYYHCDRALRPTFYKKKWYFENIKPYSIFVPSASYPLKGFHLLLKALLLLKNDFPQIKIITPLSGIYSDAKRFSLVWKNFRSSGYARYLTSFIKKHELSKHIITYNVLNEKQMADCFSKAHLFVLPSFIENSPNALAEAQIIGTPSIVSDVGGVSSMAENEKNALFFPSGDYSVLAHQIRRIFQDNELAQKISYNSRKVASIRHDKTTISTRMVDMYNDIIARTQSLK